MASATALTGRIDALAVALRAAGVSPDRAATILGSAATATMNALLLDAVLEETAEQPVAAAPSVPQESEPLRAAA